MLGFGAVGEAPLGALPNRFVEQIRNGSNVATVVVSGLIIPERQDAEGILVKSYGALWLEIARQLGTDWSKAFQLSSREWEEMLAGAFAKEGYQVTLTPSSGDRGRDVIAVRDGVGSMRILGSMKRYAPDNLVTRAHVHEMFGVVGTDLGATKGIMRPRLTSRRSSSPIRASRRQFHTGLN
ncbi:restriction endonuclease [Bradyrhizobium sp.]|uniref:restriction endonuclease n=1 Tax=Bradyrhizobium sp. TaxID=376 RepID=UPI00351F4EB1